MAETSWSVYEVNSRTWFPSRPMIVTAQSPESAVRICQEKNHEQRAEYLRDLAATLLFPITTPLGEQYFDLGDQE